jgi:hypothetical protein
VTATSSFDAVQLRLICEGETALALTPVGLDGAVVSKVAGVVAIAATDWPEGLPDMSTAWIVYE